jgi:hypothetical protein
MRKLGPTKTFIFRLVQFGTGGLIPPPKPQEPESFPAHSEHSLSGVRESRLRTINWKRSDDSAAAGLSGAPFFFRRVAESRRTLAGAPRVG